MTHLISPAKACRECEATRLLAAVQSAGGTKWRDVGRDGLAHLRVLAGMAGVLGAATSRSG
jgi:hypothetical protein